MSEVHPSNEGTKNKEVRPRPPEGGWAAIVERAREGPIAPSLMERARDLVQGPIGEALHLRENLDSHPEIIDADLQRAGLLLGSDEETRKVGMQVYYHNGHRDTFAGHLESGRLDEAAEYLQKLATQAAESRGGAARTGCLLYTSPSPRD